MHPLETYLSNLRQIRATGAGTDETSYYGPLEALLNAVGEELDPSVRCVMQVRQQGAGLPDGGLFTADELGDEGDAEFGAGALPSQRL